MNKPIMISCPHHPQKRFFKCCKCDDIEIFCDECKITYKVTVRVDDDGVSAAYMLVKKSA